MTRNRTPLDRRRNDRRKNAGFGLLEVLVTLIVLSIGLLGVAGLQLVSLRSLSASTSRGHAVLLAYDIADRMRANPLAVQDLDGNLVGFYDSTSPNYTVAGVAADQGCSEGDADAVECSIDDIAENDLFEWNQSLANLLPNGQGTVCTDSDPADATPCDGVGNVYSITINWNEREADGFAAKAYTMRFKL